MKHTFIWVLLSLLTLPAMAQFQTLSLNHHTPVSRKGELFFYWGWNRSVYTASDIHFTGDDYVFVLSDVVARDRQSAFEGKLYLNPGTATIPQYNFRLGYFFHSRYSISFGIDHMKYVMQQNQAVAIRGTIENSGTAYDGSYRGEDIILSDDFLKFEHTDGLNYINLELRRQDALIAWKHGSVNSVLGIGSGILFPRTNATLLGNARNDVFHLSGFGLGLMAGLNILFYNHVFVQSEWKGGYINMPDIRTTASTSDKAAQQFFFSQVNILFGGSFYLGKNKPSSVKPQHTL